MMKQHAGRRTASTPRGIAPKADRTKSLHAHTHTHTRACMHTQLLGGPIGCTQNHFSPMCTHASQPSKCTEMQSACAWHTCNHSSCSCSPGTGRYTKSRHRHVHSMHTCGCSTRMQSLHANATRACKNSINAHATAARTCNHIPMHVQSHHHAHTASQHPRTCNRSPQAAPTPCSPTHTPTRTRAPCSGTHLPPFPLSPPSHTQLPDTQAYFYCSCQEHEKPFCQHSARAIYEPGLFE